jgi:hypothetical protein
MVARETQRGTRLMGPPRGAIADLIDTRVWSESPEGRGGLSGLSLLFLLDDCLYDLYDWIYD